VGIRRSIAGAVIGAIVIAGCGQPAADSNLPPTPLPVQGACAAAAEPGSLCIIVLGDSIAAGAPLTSDDRWWVRLAKLLGPDLPGRRVVVDSWGVPGSHVDVLESAAHDQPGLATYDLAIVIEGINDVNAGPIAQWRPRYEAALAAIQRPGLTVIVGTPPPNLENGAFDGRYDALAAALRDIATAGHRPLLDIDASWHDVGVATASTYYVDAIHQSAAGQTRMARLAHDLVLDTLARMRPAG